MRKSIFGLWWRLAAALFALVAFAVPAAAQQQVITLHGAVQFNDDHAFNRALLKFEELVKKYYGKPVNFILHKNSELGLEKQYFEYMAQGKAVDYGIVSPAHMSTFSKAAPFIDAPFLFRDLVGDRRQDVGFDDLVHVLDALEHERRVDKGRRLGEGRHVGRRDNAVIDRLALGHVLEILLFEPER